MKQFCCYLLLFFCFPAFGQLYPLEVLEDDFRFQVTVMDRQLALSPAIETAAFKSKKDFPVLLAIRLDGSDLVLDYQPGKKGAVLTYEISLSLQMPDSMFVAPLPYELSIVAGTAGIMRLVWMDLVEKLPDFTTTYTLRVRRALMGAVNCEGFRPGFTLKKKLPHYAAGGVGLALLGLSQVYRNQSSDYYTEYRKRWLEGSESPGAADNPYDKALEKDRSARIVAWTGVGILAANALLYTWRAVKIKKRQRLYDRFCVPKTSLIIRPEGIPGPSWANTAPAAGIRFRFDLK